MTETYKNFEYINSWISFVNQPNICSLDVYNVTDTNHRTLLSIFERLGAVFCRAVEGDTLQLTALDIGKFAMANWLPSGQWPLSFIVDLSVHPASLIAASSAAAAGTQGWR